MIAGGPPLNSGFILTDPSDPRYQFISKLKARFGTFLHDASVSLRQQGDQNTLDAVRILVCTHRLGSVLVLTANASGQVYQDLHVGVRRQP